MSGDSDARVARSLKLTLQYDGTDFHGWQRQPGMRTAQGTLEDALSRLLNTALEVNGASRTDAGVHATGQVATLECVHSIPTERLVQAVNGLLPADLRVVEAQQVTSDFHARFSAVGKHYRYLIDRRPIASPFDGRYSLHLIADLDIEAMEQAAASFLGRHDFAAFQCATDQAPESTVREIGAVIFSEYNGLLAIHVWGQSFLYKMVRTMVGTLLEVGRRSRTADSVISALQACDRRTAGATAPAQGLCLIKVYYDEDEFSRDYEDTSAVAYRNMMPRGIR